MTDQVPSGENSAQAGSPDTAGANSAASTPTPAFGVFTETRGSGLARGKRPSQNAAPAAAAITGEYKPTALEVITPEREYKNPFSGETSTPRAEVTPVVERTLAPSAGSTPAPDSSPATPIVERPTWKPQPRDPGAAAKSELNILPPAETKRTSVSWEKPSQENRRSPDYPNRAPRRDDRRNESQGNFQQKAPQERTSNFRNDRPERNDRAEAAKPVVKKSGGFIAWLKGLFTKKTKAPEATAERGNQFDREGQNRRRRHRGNRGRSFNSDRSSGYQGQGGQKPNSGERREGGNPNRGGNYPRRPQGGPRHQDNGPRQEGQQGGGYI